MQAICREDELADRQCREFTLQRGDEDVAGFVCRVGGSLYAYRNHCPHTGAPLNWMPEQFFNHEGDFLQCAIHGALFKPEDGLCVHGPCQGRSLEPLPITVRAGVVHIPIE